MDAKPKGLSMEYGVIEKIAAGHFVPPGSPEVQKICTAIWTELQK